MKKLLGALLACVLVLTGCGQTDSNDPLADGVLTIGMEADYAPYNWTTTKDKASDYAVQLEGSNSYVDGYDIRVASKLADELGVKLEVKKISWDGLIPSLKAGDIDAIIAGMSPTEERKQQIDFTDAYYSSNPKQKIIVKSDSKFKDAKTFADLKGANISAQQGTFQVNLIDQLPENDNKPNPLPDYGSLMQATKSGTIDGYIVERPVAEAQTKANKDLVALDLTDKFKLDPAFTSSAIGVNKGNEDLTNKINEALKSIDQNTRESWMEEAKKASDTE